MPDPLAKTSVGHVSDRSWIELCKELFVSMHKCIK